MTGWRSVLILALACLLLTSCGSARLVSSSSLGPEERQARWEAYRTPGPHHERMGRHVGSWRWTLTSWSEPGAEPTISEGRSTFERDMDGLFLTESASGSTMDLPFTGKGRLGFDNAAAQHMSFWTDNMGSGMTLFRGRCSGQCNVITLQGEVIDAITGRPRPSKLVYRWVDDDTFRVESWAEPADGPAVRLTEVVYTRG
jgi:hypothetical protein